MQSRLSHRSSLFLLEFMIAILFFMLASALCVRIFVKSHVIEQENEEMNHTISSAVSIAEIFRSQEDPFSFLEKEYPKSSIKDMNFSIFYDSTWKPCDLKDSVYILELKTENQDNFSLGFIKIFKNDVILYELNLKKYSPERRLYDKN